MIMVGETAVLGEEPVPVPLALIIIPHASTVKGSPLVKITTLQPMICFILAIKEFVKIKYFGM
jgi:hypothetical protein